MSKTHLVLPSCHSRYLSLFSTKAESDFEAEILIKSG